MDSESDEYQPGPDEIIEDSKENLIYALKKIKKMSDIDIDLPVPETDDTIDTLREKYTLAMQKIYDHQELETFNCLKAMTDLFQSKLLIEFYIRNGQEFEQERIERIKKDPQLFEIFKQTDIFKNLF
jgi:hypothetical protein